MVSPNVQTAIAAAIDLRCFALLTKRADGVIGVDLPDIGLVKEFKINELPWDAVDGAGSSAVEAAPKSVAAQEILVRGLDFLFIFRSCDREDACRQVSTPSLVCTKAWLGITTAGGFPDFDR